MRVENKLRTVKSYVGVTDGVRNVGVARQEQVCILRIGHTGTMPTKRLVLLTGRSPRELQPDVERDETKPSSCQAWLGKRAFST